MAAADRAATEAGSETESLDARHVQALKEIIGRIGWPGRSAVGDKAAYDAWLIVQHADHHIDFQCMCLELLRRTRAEEADPALTAYLDDRICVNLGRPQIYGTQFTRSGDMLVPRPIVKPEELDQRRASVGLDPLDWRPAKRPNPTNETTPAASCVTLRSRLSEGTGWAA